MYVYDALDVGPRGVDGGVQGEAGLVDPQVGAAPVYHLPLEVDLHLEGRASNQRLHQAI